MMKYSRKEIESYQRIRDEISYDRKKRKKKKPQFYTDLRKFKARKKEEMEIAIEKQKQETEFNRKKLEWRKLHPKT